MKKKEKKVWTPEEAHKQLVMEAKRRTIENLIIANRKKNESKNQ